MVNNRGIQIAAKTDLIGHLGQKNSKMNWLTTILSYYCTGDFLSSEKSDL